MRKFIFEFSYQRHTKNSIRAWHICDGTDIKDSFVSWLTYITYGSITVSNRVEIILKYSSLNPFEYLEKDLIGRDEKTYTLKHVTEIKLIKSMYSLIEEMDGLQNGEK